MSGIIKARCFTNKSRAFGFLETVLEHGVGRHVKQLKRLTMKFCDVSQNSFIARQFVEERLIDFAAKHPTVVMYAFPESNAEPQVCAEYLNGREEIIELQKMDCDDILFQLEQLTFRSGVEIIKIRKNIKTSSPSIQGEWHPFLHKKDYDITKPLDYSLKLANSWDPLATPWKRYYRKNELHKINKRPKLTLEEKSELPLGKWGPTLPPTY